MEFPVGNEQQRHWFLLQANRLAGVGNGLVIHLANITERKNSEQLREESEQFANSIVESAPDAIVVANARGIITRANRRAYEIFGYDGGVLEGQAVEILLPTAMRGSHVGLRNHYLVAPTRRRMVEGNASRQVVAQRQDGSVFPVEVGLSPVTLRGELHIVVLLSDISQRFTLEKELREHRDDLEQKVAQRTAAQEAARAEAERLARVKTEFLSNMSHEIRTPLNAVLGLAQIGQRRSDNAQVRRLFDQMLDSGKLLLGIINDILDFSKIEAGKLSIEKAPISLARLIEHFLVLCETRAREKGLVLRVMQEGDLPPWVEGDFLRITQVLGNLLSNAIKFTEAGGVTLGVACKGEQLVFSVADTGIGLTEAQVARLFTPFEQADTSTTRKFGGTGLGLAISRRLVELMGGTIAVESRSGVGSCFTVLLPLHAIESPADEETRAAGEISLAHERGGMRLKGYRFLAAEDNPVNQLVLEDMLSLEGADLCCVEDGLQALSVLQQEGGDSFDLVLTDIQMPRMDGHELARRVQLLYPGLPIVGLTAHALPEERQRCLDNGMLAHVSKPIEMEVLVDVLQKHARRPKTRSDGGERGASSRPSGVAAESSTACGTPAGDVEVIDWVALLERFQGRQAFIDKLVATSLSNLAGKGEALRDAQGKGDYDAIAFIAHSLKGVSANMKARTVNAISEQAETVARARKPQALVLAEQLASAAEVLVAALQSRAEAASATGETKEK
jgi:PAS domain S-box-containing protein